MYHSSNPSGGLVQAFRTAGMWGEAKQQQQLQGNRETGGAILEAAFLKVGGWMEVVWGGPT
jgi:hypothetical protein